MINWKGGMICMIALSSIALPCFASSDALKPTPFDWNAIRYVHAFGDSYTFVQGVQGHTNFSFIGDELKPSFTPQELLANEIVFRHTSSNGANWIEFLTGCFSGRPSLCARQLWDFAFAGADIDGKLLPLHHDFTIPLVEQVQQWINFAANFIPHPPGKTLTAWWIGINDTGDTINNSTITDFKKFWNVEMESYFQAVQQATDRGLSAHLFINVPPGERAPASINNPSKAAVQKAHIDLYNQALAEHVATFKTQNPGVTVLTFDAHSWFNTVLDHPDQYGFTNITGVCTCTDPAGFFWYDSGHPTERVHQLLAKAIEDQLKATK